MTVVESEENISVGIITVHKNRTTGAGTSIRAYLCLFPDPETLEA